jgi:DNA-binding SARP family transcriptional activator
MSDLRVSLLGPPVVEAGEEPVSLKPRKVLALLAYLAATNSRHTRDTIAELLNPTLGRERARAGFRQCLSLLRASVGEEWIRSDADGVSLEHGVRLWTDLREIKRLWLEGTRADRAGDTALALRLAGEAEALFRGEFLQGFSLRDSAPFEVWQRAEEESCRRDHITLLTRLVALLRSTGDDEGAIGPANRWLNLDPCDETAHRELMRLYAVTGRRSEALHQYERCRETLRREQDSSPDEETEALRRAIQEGKLASRRTTVSIGLPGVRPPGNLRRELTSFVGRERELAAVVDALGQDTVRIVTLTGTGGTGKTRLALEAALASFQRKLIYGRNARTLSVLGRRHPPVSA